MINQGVVVLKTQSGDQDQKNVGARGQSHEKETGLEIVDVHALEIERRGGRGLEEEKGQDHEKDMAMEREDQDLVSTRTEGVGEVRGGMEEEGEEVVGNDEEESTTILASAKESNTRGTWKNR